MEDNQVHVQSGHCGRYGDYVWAHALGLLLTKADLAADATRCPTCQQQRPKLSP